MSTCPDFTCSSSIARTTSAKFQFSSFLLFSDYIWQFDTFVHFCYSHWYLITLLKKINKPYSIIIFFLNSWILSLVYKKKSFHVVNRSRSRSVLYHLQYKLELFAIDDSKFLLHMLIRSGLPFFFWSLVYRSVSVGIRLGEFPPLYKNVKMSNQYVQWFFKISVRR